eukprot:g2943.t1
MTLEKWSIEEENAALEELKGLIGVDALEADALKSNDEALVRFLRARELHVKAAYDMWLKWINWRKEYKVDLCSEAQVAKEIATGKAKWTGKDKLGRPTCIIRPRFHHPKESSTSDIMQFFVYMLEKGTAVADAAASAKGKEKEENDVYSGQLAVIYDRTGMTMKNVDFKLFGLMKELSGLAQDFYAERLGAVFVIGANWFYWALWKIIRPFLTERTRNKIHILNSHSELLKYFDLSELKIGGGKEYYEMLCRIKKDTTEEESEMGEEVKCGEIGNDLPNKSNWDRYNVPDNIFKNNVDEVPVVDVDDLSFALHCLEHASKYQENEYAKTASCQRVEKKEKYRFTIPSLSPKRRRKKEGKKGTLLTSPIRQVSSPRRKLMQLLLK